MADVIPKELIELSKVITEEKVRKYIGYLDNKDALKVTDGIELQKRHGAILLDSDIDDLCNSKKRGLPLIDPFVKEGIRPASYHLRLGNAYRVGDEQGYLSEEKKILKIPRHGIAIVTTYEWMNIPAFLIARWNLKVKMVYRGLVWVGGAQVDPGYQGFLFCPIYNLSNQEQELVYKDSLFTIDFVTTRFDSTPGYNPWQPQDKFATFDFNRLDGPYKIKSAPKEQFDDLQKTVLTISKDTKMDLTNMKNELTGQIKDTSDDMNQFRNLSLSATAIIITAITIMATLNGMQVKWDSDWIPAVLSFVALLLSILAIGFSIFNRKIIRGSKTGSANTAAVNKSGKSGTEG